MANVFIEESTMTAIGDAIRAKTGGTAGILPANMPAEIASITTGGGGGGGSITGGLGLSGSVTGWDGMPWGVNATVNPYVNIPEDAIFCGGCLKMRYEKFGSNGSVSAGYTDYVTIDSSDYTQTESVKTNGRKYVYFGHSESITIPSDNIGKPMDINHSSFFIMPNVTYENGDIVAGPDCKGLFCDNSSYSSVPCYMRTVDTRGSQVEVLPAYFAQNHNELKKVYLSEVFAKLVSYQFRGAVNLEELHFTSTTPPTASSGWYTDIPTTCTFYVPAGALSTYKGTSNYPSTYTYIEE